MMKFIISIVIALLLGFVFGKSTTDSSKKSDSKVFSKKSATGSPSLRFERSGIRIMDNYPLAKNLAKFDRSLTEELFFRNDDRLKRDLFAELVTQDVTAAIEYLEIVPEEEEMELYHILAEKWSNLNASAAFEWFSNRADSFERSEYFNLMENILYPLAIESPDLASDFIAKSEYSNTTKEQLITALAKGWGEQSSEAAFKWLEKLSQTDLSSDLFRNSYILIMRQQIGRDPIASAHAIGELKSPLLQEQLAKIAAQPLAAKNLNEALGWIEGLINDNVRQVALSSILETADQNVTNSILDHAITSDFDQRSMEMLFLQAAGQNPTKAASRFNEVSSSAQPSVASAIATNWFSSSPEEATNWINQLPQGANFDAAATSVARLSFHDHPIRALDWANKVSDSESRVELFSQIVKGSEEAHLNDLDGYIKSNKDPEIQKLIIPILNERLNEVYSDIVIP